MKPNQDYVTADDGVRLLVERVGTGPQAVVIPNRVYMLEDFSRLAAGRTLLFSDPRNRGLSDSVTDRSKVERGVHHDVDDLESIRRHYGLDRLCLLGHSYLATVVVLYAMTYPDRVERVVQLGPIGPDYARKYPAELTATDDVVSDVLTKLEQLQKDRQSLEAPDYCKKFWTILRRLYVLNPADADRLKWEPCDLPNEINFMKPWTAHILPSLHALRLSDQDMQKVRAPVLTIHGREDRSSPYGGGREWALRLPNARLLTVAGAAHVPWIEAPELTFGAIDVFLSGEWPESAERVTSW